MKAWTAARRAVEKKAKEVHKKLKTVTFSLYQLSFAELLAIHNSRICVTESPDIMSRKEFLNGFYMCLVCKLKYMMSPQNNLRGLSICHVIKLQTKHPIIIYAPNIVIEPNPIATCHI